MLFVLNNLLAHNLLIYLFKIFSLAYHFPICVMFSYGIFPFAMITNIGVSRYGDSWWSFKWWRWSCL